MPQRNANTAKQDRFSVAVLSVVALCLKLLMPLFTAVFISSSAAAQPAENTGTFDQQSVVQSLKFICTPTGILLSEENGKNHPMDFMDHCDFCIIGAFLTVPRDAQNGKQPALLQVSNVWQVLDQDRTRKLVDNDRHNSRAPPRV